MIYTSFDSITGCHMTVSDLSILLKLISKLSTFGKMKYRKRIGSKIRKRGPAMTYFMYLFCLIVWGLNFITVKIQGTPVALEVSLTYRLAMTAVLFILFALFVKRTNKPSLL